MIRNYKLQCSSKNSNCNIIWTGSHLKPHVLRAMASWYNILILFIFIIASSTLSTNHLTEICRYQSNYLLLNFMNLLLWLYILVVCHSVLTKYVV